MKKVLFILLSIFALTAFAKKKFRKRCSLTSSIKPKCYHKRDAPILNISLIYYGNESDMNIEHLEKIEGLLKERFSKATQQELTLNIQHKAIVPFKHKIPEGYTYNNIEDKKRLQRIWYYDNVGWKINLEMYEEYKRLYPEQTKTIDVLLTITGAQFDALGLANGRVSTTEYPQEIAWNLPNGGRVNYPTDYELVDELIHELGHNMFIGHATSQCQKISYNAQVATYSSNEERMEGIRLARERTKACCEASPSKNDVMSYCRNRSNVDENFMHGFESCNLGMIKKLVIPAMLKGRRWNVAGRVSCR